MSALQFPPGAIDILNYNGPMPNDCDSPWSKWLIYSLDSASKEANELFTAATSNYVAGGYTEDEDLHLRCFLRPANQDFPAPDIQHILDHHFRLLEEILGRLDSLGTWGWDVYSSGFIVITDADWREKGVTAVHCDEQRGKWKVTQCNNIPVDELSDLESVREVDEFFDNLIDQFGGDNNDGPDNQGGPAPVEEWQFAVYCSSNSQIAATVLRNRADRDHDIPDPRGDASYDIGDACLCFLNQNLSADRVNEDWPLAYAKFIRDPKVYPSVYKRHPSLFVHVCGGLSNIEIVKMEWDHDIARSDEELMKVGREIRTTT